MSRGAAIELLALGRQFGKAVILCTQGPSALGELGPQALDQAARDAGWSLAFRQGTRDSTTASRLLGVRWVEERSWSAGMSGDRETVRLVEQPYVSASALEDLQPAIAYLRVPAMDGRKTRVEPVRVGKPSLIGNGRTVRDAQVKQPESSVLTYMGQNSEPADGAAVSLAMVEPAEPVDLDLARVLGRLEREGTWDGECHLWPEGGCNDQGYAVVSMGGRANKTMPRVHKWLWERENGPVPRGWTLEHTCHTEAKRRGECAGGKTCKHRRCCTLSHLDAMPHAENATLQQPQRLICRKRNVHA